MKSRYKLKCIPAILIAVTSTLQLLVANEKKLTLYITKNRLMLIRIFRIATTARLTQRLNPKPKMIRIKISTSTCKPVSKINVFQTT